MATNQFGIYGTQGNPAAGNKPGAREGFNSWTDTSGNLWLFGGVGNAASSSGALNDLWKYDTNTNLWTWMKGDNTPNNAGVYGTMGVPDINNKPASRALCTTWTDADNNLWLFGGSNYNDLWKYNIATNMWTWVNGDNTPANIGVYGTKGVASPTNKPGMRNRTAIPNGKADAAGNLWLFGGYGYASDATQADMNDLWKYNIATNLWTWMGGDNVVNAPAVYGTIGIGATTNKPSARVGASMWVDTAGKVWLFGGGSSLSNWNPKYSDLWKFDPATFEWTWVKGDNTPNSSGVYGTQGTPHASNNPGGRLMAHNWIDNYGNFWLFGGYGFCTLGQGNATGTQGLNDMWKYDPLTNRWAWMKGSNLADQPGTYGVLGVPGAANTPGERSGGVSWKDKKGNLWQFAGLEWNIPTAWKNDLWKFTIPQPVAKGNLINCQTIPTVNISIINNNTWVPIFDNIGNIVAEINANGNNLGIINTSLYTRNGPCREDNAYKLYLNRNLTMSSQNAPSSNVGLRLFLLKSELDTLITAVNSQTMPSGVVSILEVDVFQNNDVCSTVGTELALPLSAIRSTYDRDYYLEVSVPNLSSFYFANKALANILPITINNFNGKRNGAVNVLQWKAACNGAVSFTIERSNDDLHFTTIGTVNSNDCLHAFAYTDAQPLNGKNYYRLKYYDVGRAIKYSSIILLTDEAQHGLTITPVPNIVTGNVMNVQVHAAATDVVNIFITDIAGRVVAKQKITVQEGSSVVTMNIPMLSAGIYYMYGIGKSGRTEVEKFFYKP